MTDRVFAFKKSRAYSARPKTHDDPELRLQVQLVKMLEAALPDDYAFTANAAGVRVPMGVAVKMKAAGVRRGWPDIQILFPTAVTRYAEVKTPEGVLSKEQKDFRDACHASGRDIWDLWRSPEDLWAGLERWKVPVVCSFERALLGRY